MNQNDKIFIAGHRGLVGSAILRQLKIRGFTNLIMRSHEELDLANQKEVKDFFFKREAYLCHSSCSKGWWYSCK